MTLHEDLISSGCNPKNANEKPQFLEVAINTTTLILFGSVMGLRNSNFVSKNIEGFKRASGFEFV